MLECRCDEPRGWASIHGTSIESALDNLKEAVALFIETADPREMKERRREHVFVTQFQAAHG